MALVTYKYMVERMPPDELRRTFAAREHTLDYLVKELRGQTRSKSLKSFFLLGPRGAGKTTLVRMLALRIEEDSELRVAWLPVMFPEEMHGVVSLRDLLSAMLRTLGENGTPNAQAWHARVESEPDDQTSRDLAVQGLHEIVRADGRRLVVFIENLDMLFADGKSQGIGQQERAALRRLLMAPAPWLMLVGSGVTSFKAIEDYDEALFQYFQPVPIDRLNDEQVRQLLFSRAAFDDLPDFETKYRLNQDKIRSLTRLTGGNPRLVLMLYETITAGAVTTIMQTLLSLVDTLTPLLKDVIEHQMTRQQARVFDALMRAGGTAQPKDLVAPTRLTLNAVNTQLTRLKDMQLLEVLGGGKGRPAYYSVPDRLLSTWYQLRYLRPNRRRIELFVEFLRLWFEEDARCEYLRSLVKSMPMCVKESAGADAAYAPLALECVAASLKDTQYAKEAEDAAIRQWLAVGKFEQAAYALAEFAGAADGNKRRCDVEAYGHLRRWALEHADLPLMMRAAQEVVSRDPQDFGALETLSFAFLVHGEERRAEEYLDRILCIASLPEDKRAWTYLSRGTAKALRGEAQEAIVDYTAAIQVPGARCVDVAKALLYRGIAKGQQGDVEGEIGDYTATIELAGAPVEQVAKAFFDRGVARRKKGDVNGEITDFTSVINSPGATSDQVAMALLYRGVGNIGQGDMEGATADLQKAVANPTLDVEFRCIAVGALIGMAPIRESIAANIVSTRKTVDDIDPAIRGRFVISLMRKLCDPMFRTDWPRFCRALCENQPPEVAEQLRFLLPVCDALESNDRSKLDPLPPEQRDFALEVLQGFESSN